MYSRLVLCTLEDWQRVCVPRFFFFNDTATTEIYTLSLHDALPIWLGLGGQRTRCEQRGDAHHESRAHRAPPAPFLAGAAAGAAALTNVRIPKDRKSVV